MIHPKVLAAHDLLARLAGAPQPVVAEADNAEYGAALSRIGPRTVRYRVGKLTPTKVGLFVALWRRAPSGATEPFPADDVDLLAIVAEEGPNRGLFVFDQGALALHGIGSVAGAGGKRGFRVYPPWSPTANAQARRTQAWQGGCFADTGDAPDADRLGMLIRR